eukprot:935175-Pyramimonas_sp.AAC.1
MITRVHFGTSLTHLEGLGSSPGKCSMLPIFFPPRSTKNSDGRDFACWGPGGPLPPTPSRLLLLLRCVMPRLPLETSGESLGSYVRRRLLVPRCV